MSELLLLSSSISSICGLGVILELAADVPSQLILKVGGPATSFCNLSALLSLFPLLFEWLEVDCVLKKWK